MTESQLKPIKDEELPEIKEVNEEKTSIKDKKDEKVIQSLPTWSIEPPIEIKRG